MHCWYGFLYQIASVSRIIARTRKYVFMEIRVYEYYMLIRVYLGDHLLYSRAFIVGGYLNFLG